METRNISQTCEDVFAVGTATATQDLKLPGTFQNPGQGPSG